jgi:hypothetical protein
MENNNEIINKVAQSGLIEFNLEEYYIEGERVLLDIKDKLFQGLILREKDFREFVKNHPWESYQNQLVAITCTADAIVPTWAYMLLSASLQPYAKRIVFGNLETLETILYHEVLAKIDYKQYIDQRVVIKGCSKVNVPIAAYTELTARLRPFAKSIMFGEPCSTVPVFKKGK